MTHIQVDNYSKIYLGKSVTNRKTYILKSSIKLGTKFITEPFGTTRTRFQFPEIFTYSIKLCDINNTKLYELTVERNNKILCSGTAKYFWNSGWDVDLFITNVPDMCENIKNFPIKSLLPCDYGIIESSFQNHLGKPEIGMVIPIYSRAKYLKQCLSSLNNSNLQNCVLIFVDESMTQDINDDKIETHNLIQNYTNTSTNIIKIYKNKHGNMFDSALRGFDVLRNFCDYLINLDSDTIHKSNWIDEMVKTFKIAQTDYNNDKIILSGFNTVNSGLHKVLKTTDNYIIKNTVGGCNLFFKSKCYDDLRPALISHKWDTNLISQVKKLNYKILTTNPSVIDHIGFETTGHRNIKNETEYDIAVDY